MLVIGSSFVLILMASFMSIVASANSQIEIEFVDAKYLLDSIHIKKPSLMLVILCDERLTCSNHLETFEQLAQMQSEQDESQRVAILATDDTTVSNFYGLYKFPQLLFFRQNHYLIYSGNLNANVINEWLDETRERITHTLDDNSFEHLTQASTGATTGDWFVLFYKTECKTFTFIQPSWEKASIMLKGRVNLAYVDFETNPKLQKRFALFNSPTLFYFKQGYMYRYDIDKLDHQSLVHFVENSWYRNLKAERVPIEPSWFDDLTDSIVKLIKEKPIYIYVFFAIMFLVLAFIVYSAIMTARNTLKPRSTRYYENNKDD